MTRTTDTDDHERFQPLGAPIRKPEPATEPGWKQAPGAAEGVQVGPDGRFRTRLPLPKG